MSILGEQGTLEEKHLYRLAGGMAAGGEQQGTQLHTRLWDCWYLYKLQETAGSRSDVFKKCFKFILGVTAETLLLKSLKVNTEGSWNSVLD